MKQNCHLKKFVVDESTGQVICNCGCGMVCEEDMPDMSSFSREKDTSNTKAFAHSYSTYRRHDNNLTTEIGNPETKNSNKLNKLHEIARVSGREEAKLIRLLQSISKHCEKFNLPNVIQDDASYLAHKIIAAKDDKGVHCTQYAIPLIFIAAQRSKLPNRERILKIFPTKFSRNKCWRNIREIKLLLDIHVELKPVQKFEKKRVSEYRKFDNGKFVTHDAGFQSADEAYRSCHLNGWNHRAKPCKCGHEKTAHHKTTGCEWLNCPCQLYTPLENRDLNIERVF